MKAKHWFLGKKGFINLRTNKHHASIGISLYYSNLVMFKIEVLIFEFTIGYKL